MHFSTFLLKVCGLQISSISIICNLLGCRILGPTPDLMNENLRFKKDFCMDTKV